ncbi:MAG: hypothetical protein IT307_13090 [Chloroflexi bacterium]|nr:hypothetical protein [Chloroflexota bacterium]
MSNVVTALGRDPIGRASRTVLLIDSTLSARRLLAVALIDADSGVIEAADGCEGVALDVLPARQQRPA